MSVDLAQLWAEAETFAAFMARVKSQPTLWEGVYRTAGVPGWAVAAFGSLPNGLRMLVLNADWCLDSANTLPVLARLAEVVPGVELRLLERDAHLDVMDRYLTSGARSIPLAILLDRDLEPWGGGAPAPPRCRRGCWRTRSRCPRQSIQEERKWYARDKGETTLREILQAVAGSGKQGAGSRQQEAGSRSRRVDVAAFNQPASCSLLPAFP